LQAAGWDALVDVPAGFLQDYFVVCPWTVFIFSNRSNIPHPLLEGMAVWLGLFEAAKDDPKL
jgi:hypothetical protein